MSGQWEMDKQSLPTMKDTRYPALSLSALFSVIGIKAMLESPSCPSGSTRCDAGATGMLQERAACWF